MRVRRALGPITAASVLAGMIGCAWLGHATRAPAMPSFADVHDRYQASESVLLDRQGRELQRLRVDFSSRRLDWTPLALMSPALPVAVIGSEDRRFASHEGVDVVALLGAARDRLAGVSRRGASTLEMQLVALLDPALRAKSGRRGVLEKLRQMRAARALASSWSKDETLEAYLNLVGFRGESEGIAAAAQALFDKSPSGLTADESRILAALLPAPRASSQQVARRACAAGGLQGRDCDALRSIAFAALDNPRAMTLEIGLAPHLARRLLRTPGERVRTTLDLDVQTLAHHALESQLRRLDALQVRDGAAVVVDNRTGDVLAYVGSAGPASRAAQVDGARAQRQAGSTLKPFLYAMAIERGWLTAASLLDDAPVALEAGPGLYLPQNYEHDFKGLVSVRTALAGSLNIPAVRTLIITGIEPFRERLNQLGYVGGLTESGEYYGYSLALGSTEVSLLEQVNAYRTLANGGRYTPLRLSPDEPVADARPVISEGAAWIVSDILADRAARAVTFDFDGPLSTSYWSAVKTGTSKDLRDNWCIGYTSRYTVAVWVGNFEGDPMRTVSGITGAAPAWREILDGLQSGAAAAPRTPPEGLTRQRVQFTARTEGDRDEWFLAGTQMARITPAVRRAPRARLASPANGSLIALDPDIPLDRQHVVLRADPVSARLHLRLNQRDLGSAAQARFWTPMPGDHLLELIDAEGRSLDAVTFTVRPPA